MRYAVLLALLILALPACTKEKAPDPAAEEEITTRSLHDRAEAVGNVGDATLTTDLKKGLTGAVDSAEQRAKELEEANQ